MSMHYCCTRFMELVTRGTERGLAIVPKRRAKLGDSFFLQFRATAEADDKVLVEATNIPLTRKVEQAILFCPWCGARLAEVYSSARFDELPYVEDTAEPLERK